MSFKSTAIAAIALCSLALPAFAADIMIDDSYARASGKSSKSGAAFMILRNMGAEDDTLIDARSTAAKRIELHTHIEDANGVMAMREDKDGFPVPAGGMHALARGGDHVMFMGLNAPFEQGAMIPLTLVFEKAGEIEISVPVDLERKPNHGAMKHKKKGH